MKMAADILDEGGNTYLTQSYCFYNPAVSYMCNSALPQTYPRIENLYIHLTLKSKNVYNSVVSISISQPLRYYTSALPQTYPRIKKIKCLYFKMLN
ncbi:unnamed protein product [Brassica oleracea]